MAEQKYINATITGTACVRLPVSPETLAWLEKMTPDGSKQHATNEELAERVLDEYRNADAVWSAMDVELEYFDVVTEKQSDEGA